jgi:hypothetical protein
MSNVANARINTFGPLPKADVPQSEPVISLTLDQLKGLIESAVQEAINPILDEIKDLETKIAALESTQEQEITRICLDIAYDRQRITKLEIPEQEPPKEYSFKVASHLDEIVKALVDRENQSKLSGQKWDYMAFWEVEQLLDLSHRRISQLADIARNDPRFALGWHPKRKNMKVFRLNHFDLGSIAHLLHKEINGGK